MRQFLLNCAYFTHLKYCLLGGKYPLIPIRYGTPGYDDRDGKVFNEIEDQYHVPTDWYFAELSRNWNVDGDVFYGEFTEENIEDGFERLYSADLFLGRLPCLTVEEVNNYINKLEIYLMNPGFGDTSYLSAAHSHFSDTSLRSNIIPKPTLSANQYIEMSYSTHDIYEQTEHVSGAFVLSSIVDKKYGFVDFHGHGNPFSIQVSDKRNYPSAKISVIDALDDWHKYGPVEENNGLDKLDNFGYPNIMYVNSCNTAPMDSPNYCGYGTLYDNYHDVPMTLSESFLLGKNYGGVAYIGNTRTGYNDETPQLEAAFFKNFWRSGVYSEIGRLFNQSNWSTNSNRNGLDYIARAGYYVRLSRNLFGDPQLMIWRGEPTKLTEFYVSRGDKNLNVGWSGDYGGASGCEYVVVEPDGSVHRGYLGTNLGRVSNVSSNSTVTVIKDNMIPYICDLSLQNIRFKERSYVYCKDAVLGKAIRKFSQGNVEFRIGSDYTIDATGDVALKNGTIVRYGAILHIFTPGCCTLDSAIIESGAIIDIHAPQIINYIPDVDLKNDNRFIIHGYDKYGMGRAPVEIINKGNILKSRGKSDDYRPMLEVGKEWRYALVDCAAFADEFEPDLKRVYRIDGIENIDGKDYYVMNTYTGDALTPDGNTPYGYFREDRAEKKVYFLDNFDYDAAPMRTEYIRTKRWKEEEFEIYDFASAPSGYVETELNVCENVYRGFTYESEALDETNPRDGYFEGLGWTPIPDERLNRHGMFDILGYCSVPMGEGASYFPFLYEIAAADGTILYRYDPNLPASLETAVEDPDINAPTEYFTLQGVKVAGEPSSPGIYLRKTGNTVTKVIVK